MVKDVVVVYCSR